jgi:predicted phage terminase large subunit-like protein
VRDTIAKGGGRLIIEWPPRHGKSYYLSWFTPVWFLNAFPSKHVMLVSNTAKLAEKWGRRARNVIESNPDKLEVRIAQDSAAKDDWSTTAGGGMLTKGVEGTITGFDADLLIVDDPHAGQREANSDTIRNGVIEWYETEARNRLEPGGTIIVFHQRLHESDLIGHLTRKDPKGWRVITLRGIAEDDDPLGRAEGEALWPDRFSSDDLLSLKKDIGSHAFESQFQQRPFPPGGEIFKQEHFRYFSESVQADGSLIYHLGDRAVHASACWYAQTCDTAMTAKTTSDWTAVVTFAITPDKEILVLDVATAQIEVPAQLPFLIAQRAKWPHIRWQAVEEKGSGVGLIQQARFTGSPLRALKPGSVDKVTRAAPLATKYENGTVWHPPKSSTPWLAKFEAELLAFPNGTHDDQVDCAAYMGLEVAASRRDGLIVL